jgi:SAM-dependent methyltransferase
VVGEQGGRGGGTAPLTGGAGATAPLMTEAAGDHAQLSAQVLAAYDSSAQDWADGPVLMYAPLATALVRAASAGTLDGQSVLDIGAGTGVAGRAALAAGAKRVVSVDLAHGMLRHCGQDLHPLAADAASLPFRDGSFDLVLAAFSLSHLPDLAAGLTQIRRTARALAASAFSPEWTHPAKDAVDATLAASGYRRPDWHDWLKIHGESAAGDPERLAAQATAAGFTGVSVRTVAVETGIRAPAEFVSWRLGMAQAAPFVRALDPLAQAELRRAAGRAVAAAGGGPLTVPMLVLTAA